MANVGSIPLYDDVINSFGEQFNSESNDSALQNLRKKGFERFREKGFPNRRSEDWKYTNITPYLLEKYSFKKASFAGELPLIGEGRVPNLDCYKITLVNGILQEDQDRTQLPSFVTLSTIEAAQNDGQFLSYLSNRAGEENSSFADL